MKFKDVVISAVIAGILAALAFEAFTGPVAVNPQGPAPVVVTDPENGCSYYNDTGEPNVGGDGKQVC